MKSSLIAHYSWLGGNPLKYCQYWQYSNFNSLSQSVVQQVHKHCVSFKELKDQYKEGSVSPLKLVVIMDSFLPIYQFPLNLQLRNSLHSSAYCQLEGDKNQKLPFPSTITIPSFLFTYIFSQSYLKSFHDCAASPKCNDKEKRDS